MTVDELIQSLQNFAFERGGSREVKVSLNQIHLGTRIRVVPGIGYEGTGRDHDAILTLEWKDVIEAVTACVKESLNMRFDDPQARRRKSR